MDRKRVVKRAKNFKRPTPEQRINNELSYKYTSGEEFTTINGHEYIGEYHRRKDGRVFTGPKKIITGLDLSVELLPYYNEQNNFTYDSLNDFKAPLKDHPKPAPYEFTLAADDPAYEDGYVMRYFVQKRGLGHYAIELDQLQRDLFGSKDGIDSRLYEYVDLQWQLTGTLELIEQQNKERVNIASQVLPDLPFVIRNYVQFASPTMQTQFNSLDSQLRDKDKLIDSKNIPIKRTYDPETGTIIPPEDP